MTATPDAWTGAAEYGRAGPGHQDPAGGAAWTLHGSPYLFIAPFFVIFALFGLFPLGYTAWVSLHDWDLTGDAGFVGLENYSRLFERPGLLERDGQHRRHARARHRAAAADRPGARGPAQPAAARR